MEISEYRILYELETDYWWFRALHDMLRDLIDAPPDGLLLDAGCGTGGFMQRLCEMSPHTFGFDLSAEAARFWERRGVKSQGCIASINELPYAADTFDVVFSVDILECDGVYDAKAYAELVRVTKPGGRVIVVVPAYQWMMTRGHHRAVHAVRRYNKHNARALADGLPVTVERLTHAFAVVFPAVAMVRLYNRWQERGGDVAIKSELQPMLPFVNKALYGITSMERFLLRGVNMPFGSSLIMVAQKKNHD